MADLDGLRAIAILWVLSFHSWYFSRFVVDSDEIFLSISDSMPWFFNLFRRGDLGVDIFFVLSGYLLSWQLFKRKKQTGRIELARFYSHRFFRIYPLYLSVLILAVLVDGSVNWNRILGNIFAYNIWVDPMKIVIPTTWSLSVELEFYAIVPLLILLVFSGRSLAVLFAASCLLTAVWSSWTLIESPEMVNNTLVELKLNGMNDAIISFFKNLYVAMPVRITQFTVGIVGAWLVLNKFENLSKLHIASKSMLIAIILFGFALPMLHNPFTNLTNILQPVMIGDLIFGRIAFAVSVGLVIVLMQTNQLPGIRAALSANFLEPIARFSFSMYIFHPAFVFLGMYIFVGDSNVESFTIYQILCVFGVAIFGTIIFGFITWYTIERPAIRFGKKLFG